MYPKNELFWSFCENLINLDQKEEYSTSEREKKTIVVLIIIEIMIRYNNNNNNDDNCGNNTEGLSTKSVVLLRVLLLRFTI